MAVPPSSPLSQDDQQRLLEYERFVSEVIRVRQPQEQQPKAKWQIFLESASGAALITVVIGGLLGSWVTSNYQSRQADLERQRTAREKLQDLKFQETAHALDLLWTSVAAADDLMQLPTPAFLNVSTKERDNIRASYVEAESKWRSQGGTVEDFKLRYFFRDSPKATKSWLDARQSVSAYLDCTTSWIIKHPFYENGLPVGCVTERNTVDQKVDSLESAFSVNTF